MPGAKIQLDYQSDLELMVAVILSAQCTDQRVNRVTPALFARYPDARALADADLRVLGAIVRSCGLYRSKARNIRSSARIIVQRFGGRVPTRRDELISLPGVGNKSAGVIGNHLSGDPSFPVDTHVGRLARRMGLTRETNPDRVERDLRGLLPSRVWAHAHQLLVWHGRRVCHSGSPECEHCVLVRVCPRVGVSLQPERAAVRR